MLSETAVKNSLACPACRGKKQDVFFSDFYHFKGVAYSLVKCAQCSLISVDPMPSDEVLGQMYSDEYFQTGFISGRIEGSYEDIYKKRLPEMEDNLFQMEKHIPKEKRTMFEVGAAGGMFLKCAKDRGWKVSGLEFSSWGTKHANETYGIPVIQGNFLHATLPEPQYPVIFLGDVFEHFTDPLFGIQKIHKSLEPEGYVVMLLPMYISSWTFRFFMSLRGLLKDAPLPKSFKTLLKFNADKDFNPPYHVYEYSKETITELLTRNGFHVLEIRGNLPVPESLSSGPADEATGSKIFRNIALGIYMTLKFFSENFNFPLVRSLVIAKKVS